MRIPQQRRWLRRGVTAAIAAAVIVGSAACQRSTGGGTAGKTIVGFITVGSNSDAGYNEAVYDASTKVEANLGSKVAVIRADNIPETDAVSQAMQSMVDHGAKIIFATSYGYFKYALKFAQDHPDVTVLHQGGFQAGGFPANFGTYWGQAFEPVSLGGMAAGGVTRTGKLGYVYAFPIPQTLANIDGFELGALKVNPNAKTYLVNTSAWCDVTKQKQAAESLLNQGVDVLSQHQDCQNTVITAAKEKSAKIVGYHFDASALYPDGWLTGSAWNWAPVYEAIINTTLGGTFKGSKYNANWVGSFATGDNPLQVASFGSSVPAELQTKIKAELTNLQTPGNSVFKGPIYCQDGTLLFKDGEVPTYDQINSINCLVKGVIGTLPTS
jgi:basic membrane protein A and related proteins